MTRWPRVLLCIGLLLATLVVAGVADAQISPGPLSSPHAALEGSGNCLQCHTRGQGVAADKCLACHSVLRQRIANGQGLHATDGYTRCEQCHVDHAGEEFELVFWGDEGMEAFDHATTGHVLEGGHSAPQCRDCHQPRLVLAGDELAAAGKDLSRTFLGLDTRCASCHVDEHRGQFEPATCTSCHGQDDWQRAAGFEHDASGFPLTGLHRDVDCTGCHPTLTAPSDNVTYVHYRGLPSSGCVDCHADVHRNDLGTACATCHGTSGWNRVDTSRVDHERTAYPLRGRHVGLECASCHQPVITDPVAYATCTDCHTDEHVGQLRVPAANGCESCHSVEGFQPPEFSLDDHQSTAYPLEGAHLAVACDACHQPAPAGEILRLLDELAPEDAAGAPRSEPGTTEHMTTRFRFGETTCTECHADPHAAGAIVDSGPMACTSCHTVADWALVDFDHDTTRFALEGGHDPLTCSECHQASGAAQAHTPGSFAGLTPGCSGCHVDIHRGQLTSPGPVGAAEAGTRADPCQRCHTINDWIPGGFDHDRDSRYVLDGAHATVACAGCHPTDTDLDGPFVRYKPLEITCEGCHGLAGVARLPLQDPGLSRDSHGESRSAEDRTTTGRGR